MLLRSDEERRHVARANQLQCATKFSGNCDLTSTANGAGSYDIHGLLHTDGVDQEGQREAAWNLETGKDLI